MSIVKCILDDYVSMKLIVVNSSYLLFLAPSSSTSSFKTNTKGDSGDTDTDNEDDINRVH